MNWKKVTLSHYQQIYPILKSDAEEWEKGIQIVGLLNDLTETQVDNLAANEYHKLRDAASFIFSEVPKGSLPKYIKGKKGKYKVVYDIEQMPFARYAEIKHFIGHDEDNFIKNLHSLLASMVIPMKRVLGIWVEGKYDAKLHPAYADDLLYAKFSDAYYVSVFFYHLYRNWIAASQDYLENLFQQTMTQSQSQSLNQDLFRTLDGFSMLSELPTLKESLYKRLGIYPPSRHLTELPT
jgi:hypothetical protein